MPRDASRLRSALLLAPLFLAACSGTLSGSAPDPTDPGDPTPQPQDASVVPGPTDGGGPPVDPPPPGDPLAEANVMFVGHSLIGWGMPPILGALADDADRTHAWSMQLGIGANLQWQWDRGAPEGVNARETLPTGRFDVLVVTEAIPLETQIEFANSVQYAGNYYDLAQQSRPGTRVYLYETWHQVTLPDFRARLTSDRALWEQIVDGVNATRSGPDMRMIPAGTALARLVDRITAGQVPGYDSAQDLFVDDIHPTPALFYFVACVHFATIYRMSPVGLSERIVDRYGAPVQGGPSAEVARIMQTIAWEVVASDPLSGVGQ
ncbi:hypothetical protein [Sandaracinus amylolyticus]|uniref:SGNH/GDSL hydrolase family protein n=1 Tax=Sandaracinus amylolyticus TaxID=927083 RepID=A0A0F6W7F7_9BACT|nr:hypothetical protein [Sandaracinus amylolyticus]AKF09437.1 hypothetical protein DB32_006586 [Sandaracinus amylolyticus]